MYSPTLSLTSALDLVGGQRYASAALPPGKTWYPLCRGPFWTRVEILAPTGIRSQDRPARSDSLYRLSYPGPPIKLVKGILRP